MKCRLILSIVCLLVLFSAFGQSGNELEVQKVNQEGTSITSRINLLNGFVRINTPESSFGNYLQNLKLMPHGSKVVYYNGQPKYNQNLHIAVVDIDVGTRDLQQCADAVMRLYAESLFSNQKYSTIYFNFISDGKPRYFLDYSSNNTSYPDFRKYMDYVFSYANTRSLYHQMKEVRSFEDMQIGDVLIQKGNPYGHAVIIVDMAFNPQTGEQIYLLAQSYMPAQSIHILINPNNAEISPWYSMAFEGEIVTPEWVFKREDLRRFTNKKQAP